MNIGELLREEMLHMVRTYVNLREWTSEPALLKVRRPVNMPFLLDGESTTARQSPVKN